MTGVDKTPTQQLIEIRLEQEIGALLRDLYVTRRWTDQEIADHLSRKAGIPVSRGTVQEWRATFGIDRGQRTTVTDTAAVPS